MHDIEGELSFRRCTKRTHTCLVRSRQSHSLADVTVWVDIYQQPFHRLETYER